MVWGVCGVRVECWCNVGVVCVVGGWACRWVVACEQLWCVEGEWMCGWAVAVCVAGGRAREWRVVWMWCGWGVEGGDVA